MDPNDWNLEQVTKKSFQSTKLEKTSSFQQYANIFRKKTINAVLKFFRKTSGPWAVQSILHLFNCTISHIPKNTFNDQCKLKHLFFNDKSNFRNKILLELPRDTKETRNYDQLNPRWMDSIGYLVHRITVNRKKMNSASSTSEMNSMRCMYKSVL